MSVLRDLVTVQRLDRELRLPWTRRFTFTLLRLGQRLAYWVGWVLSTRRTSTAILPQLDGQKETVRETARSAARSAAAGERTTRTTIGR